MKQVYMCEYCYKIGSEDFIRKHEENCDKNPACHRCPTCKHYRVAWIGSGRCYGCKVNDKLEHSHWESNVTE